VHLPAAAPSGPSGQRLSGWTSPLPGEGGGQIIGGPAGTCKDHHLETPLAFGNLTHTRGLPYFSHELWRKTWNIYNMENEDFHSYVHFPDGKHGGCHSGQPATRKTPRLLLCPSAILLRQQVVLVEPQAAIHNAGCQSCTKKLPTYTT
jgi:hypothetical protein